ncbi:ABC transporter permease [Allopusillimonas soli]|uniref:ABC transporter permease n=1 Tax=Allopusillimonas soli TaxID=659016 RepID=A0A853F773_9BURK|nr:ABC transporter permease [Allopusillimonas soli]NYT36435.1 ABC transporter permease [Allopusillimonas soli]TEA74945.1 ABC transporter permease [Allopusillimonas soli]
MSLKRIFRINSLALWMVVIPMAIAILYYALFAVNRYVSSAQAVVRQAGNDAEAMVPGLAMMIAGVNPASREETLYLREYILSTDMMQVLDDKLQWRKHFEQQRRDPLFWIFDTTSQEDELDFYRRLVQAYYDETTGLLAVEVQALTPKFAQEVLQTILDESDRFVNELSHSLAHEQLRFAESELALARHKYEEKKRAMVDFQANSEYLNAQSSAEARATIIATLEGDLTREKAKLKALMSSLGNNTPQVRQQRVRIDAMSRQLEVEKKSLLSSDKGDKLNVIAAAYRDREIDVGLAEETYKAAMAAAENARIEATKKIRSLVRVVSPNMPQEAIYPERIYNLFTILIGLLLLYGVVRFVIATIEDHRD